MKTIQEINLVGGHTVDVYGSTLAVAEAVALLNPRQIRLFSTEKSVQSENSPVQVHELLAPTAAGLTSADVCMLDGRALKVLAVRYPSDAQYVLARVAFRRGWILGLPGLLRRVFLGRIQLGGILKLTTSQGNVSYWLFIKRTKKTVKSKALFLSKKIGPAVFFEWMSKQQIQYIVPRFYEKLPQLHRQDGDLDLLIADEDVPKVIAYLQKNSGSEMGTRAESIPIGMHSVSRGDGVPYFPPPIARKMLERAVDGPAGSRIPSPEDALHALIYHVLYHHKGYATNIPTNLPGKPEHPPENDYGALIQQKAKVLGITVGTTMEDMDEYMAKIGWQPKRDTLSKIAQRNSWVRDRFFSNQTHGGTGLTVYLLKEFGFARGVMEHIVTHLQQDGLLIVRAVAFTKEQQDRAAEHVRGGNWVDAHGNSEGMSPAAMIIGVDPQCANLPPAYAGEYERVWAKRRKQHLRHVFDEAGSSASIVHAADNTQEAWEYIEACFPHDEVEAIRAEVESKAHTSRLVRLLRWVSPTYVINAVRFTIRDFITNTL